LDPVQDLVGEGIPGQILVFASGQENERLRARGEDLEPGHGSLGRGCDAVIDPYYVVLGPHLLQSVRYAGKGAGNVPHRQFGCAGRAADGGRGQQVGDIVLAAQPYFGTAAEWAAFEKQVFGRFGCPGAGGRPDIGFVKRRAPDPAGGGRKRYDSSAFT